MSVNSNIDFLSKAIHIQRDAIRFRIGLTILVIFIGVILFIYGLFSSSEITEKLKLILPLAGVLITTLSSFPLKDIFSRKNKILGLSYLKSQYETLKDTDESENSRKINNLDQHLNKFIDNNLR